VQYHPDICKSDVPAEASKYQEEFAHICEAYDVLSDREWRLGAAACVGSWLVHPGRAGGQQGGCARTLNACMRAAARHAQSPLARRMPHSPTPPAAKRKGTYDLFGEHGLKDGEMDAQGGEGEGDPCVPSAAAVGHRGRYI